MGPKSDATAEGEFRGIYVAHWEVSRFVITTGRTLIGRARTEKWQALFPPGFELPHPVDRNSPGRAYEMRVRGRLGAKGNYGHMGFCSRQLEVLEVTECRDAPPNARTW